MALTLENEFVVSAGLEPTWRLLLDLERVSRCLPGATVEPSADDGVFAGTMRVKLGPISMTYKGTARLGDVDADARTAVIAVDGKETRGQGSASAQIRSTLAPEDGATRVRVETELNVTGRPAQFGRGIMQDVAARMLSDFADCLSRTLAEADRPGEAADETPPPPALDLAPAARQVMAARLRSLLHRLLRRPG
jgi:carbon monoxide dehydrogenase subunit G